MFEKLKIFVVFITFLSLILCNGIQHKVYQESVNIPCDTSLDCEFSQECNSDKFCQCRSDEHCSNNTALNSIVTTKIGERCQMDSDCNIQDAFCDVSEDGSCRCVAGYMVAASGKICLKAAHSLSDPCLEDIQCNSNITNSICLQNICVCAYGMHDFNNTCHTDRVLDESCDSTYECITPYSECHEHICACRRRYIISSDRQHCLLAANSFLSPCKRDEQCMATLGNGSRCFNDLCNCMYMFQYKASTKKCVKDMTLGEICSTHADCHQPGSDPSRLICILNECQCKKPIFMEEGGNCVESAVAGIETVQMKLSVLTIILVLLGIGLL